MTFKAGLQLPHQCTHPHCTWAGVHWCSLSMALPQTPWEMPGLDAWDACSEFSDGSPTRAAVFLQRIQKVRSKLPVFTFISVLLLSSSILLGFGGFSNASITHFLPHWLFSLSGQAHPCRGFISLTHREQLYFKVLHYSFWLLINHWSKIRN